MVILNKVLLTIACLAGLATAAPSSGSAFNGGLMKRQSQGGVPGVILQLGFSADQVLSRIGK